MSSPADVYQEFQAAEKRAREISQAVKGRRVSFGTLGFTGTAVDVTAGGVKVRFDDGKVERVHPDDLRFI